MLSAIDDATIFLAKADASLAGAKLEEVVAIQRHGEALPSSLEDGIAEMQALIRSAYPGATFTTEQSEEPEGLHHLATVHAADLNDVIDLFIDRLIDLQVEDGLRLHVIPLLGGKR